MPAAFFLCRLPPESVPISALVVVVVVTAKQPTEKCTKLQYNKTKREKKNKLKAASNKELLWTSR
ncbi:hypothetical protein T09_5522, partial [Trichinella sp. T9]